MMPSFKRSAALSAALSLLTAGCSAVFGEPPTYSFSLTIRVASDDGTPISGAEISTQADRPATTDPSGRVRFQVSGREGDRRTFLVRCPKEYQSPAQALVISLHRNAEGAEDAVYGTTCVPLKRTVVVAVRTDGEAGLPIYYLDEQVARTDESGAAHFVVLAAPGEPFRVVIDTPESDPELRPIDPTVELSVGPSDDILLVEQKFTRVVREPRKRAAPRPRLPQRL